MIDRLRASVALVALGGILGCARVVAPAGGPPDVVPPVLLRSTPDSGAVLVSRETPIRLEFSEWIDPATIRASLSIMPAPSRSPRIDVDGAVVTVRLKEPFDSAATTILRIGEGIADFRGAAGSTAREIPFSTGSALDSLELRIQVWSGGDSVAPSPTKAKVGLYALDSFRRKDLSRLLRRRDSVSWLGAEPLPWREKAWRWSSADSQGIARFQHLPPGRWRVIAWIDLDQDGYWRPGEEPISWAGDLDWSASRSPKWMLARLAALDTGATPSSMPSDSTLAIDSSTTDSLVAVRDSLHRLDSLRLDSLALRDSTMDADSSRSLEVSSIPGSFGTSRFLEVRLFRLDARRRPIVRAIGPNGLRMRVPRTSRWGGEIWLDLDSNGLVGAGDPRRGLPAEPWRPLETVLEDASPADSVLRIVPVDLPESPGAAH